MAGDTVMMEQSVFDRSQSEGKEIGASTYNLLIGLVLCWGFFVNYWMVLNIPVASIQAINQWVFFIGYFACCFLGIYLFNSSDNPAVSFVGYNLVVVPFGLVINLVVSQYDPRLILEAIKVTGMVTLLMMCMGAMFPQFFRKIGGALTVALVAVIIVELVMIFVFKTHQSWLDWAVVLIFCGYIGYDWARANQIPKTVDNAIDSAAALYMDIINLFLRILRIMGRK